jgi:hypothetical protein
MRAARWLLVLTLLAGAFAAATAWPRVREVETGRSSAYPNLVPRVYSARPAEVASEAEAAIESLQGWRLAGGGSGAGGHALQAEHRLVPFAPLSEEVRVTIRATAAGTQVIVRSRSRVGPWDFGQNARNIRNLLESLDGRLARSRKKVGESTP